MSRQLVYYVQVARPDEQRSSAQGRCKGSLVGEALAWLEEADDDEQRDEKRG